MEHAGMSDIVERLRDYGGNPMLRQPYAIAMHDAADEIERLRGLLDAYCNELTGSAMPEIATLRAEIERLRTLIRERLDGPPVDYGTTHANVLAWDNDWLRRAKEALER
jgi:hypothetical protein